MNAERPRGRKDLLVLGVMVGFALVFVLVATWLGQKHRTRYRLEPEPPLPPVQQRAVDALGTRRPWLPRPWPARPENEGETAIVEALEQADPESAEALLAGRSDDEAWTRHQRAVLRYLAGDDPAACLARFDALVAERPRDAAPLAARGILRLIHGQAGPALTDLEAAHALRPDDAILTLRYGLARERVSGREAARPLYEAAASALADDPDACVLLGRCLYEARDLAAAKAWAERAVEVARNWADAQFLLGETCLASGDAARARRAFLDVLQLRPDDERAKRLAARIDGRPVEDDR